MAHGLENYAICMYFARRGQDLIRADEKTFAAAWHEWEALEPSEKDEAREECRLALVEAIDRARQGYQAETRLNVRCCCTPVRIYGTLPAPKLHEFTRGFVRLIRAHRTVDPSTSLAANVETHRLEIDIFGGGNGSGPEFAWKFEGDDIPPERKLEILRQLPGFIANDVNTLAGAVYEDIMRRRGGRA